MPTLSPELEAIIRELKQEINVARQETKELAKEKDEQIAKLTEQLNTTQQELQSTKEELQSKITTNNLVVDENVGIGTQSPEKGQNVKLDVRGNLILDPNENPAIFTGTEDSELNRFLQLLNSTESRSASGLKAGGVLVSDTYNFANPSKNDLIVKGNVGIGTANPSSKFHVLAQDEVGLLQSSGGQAYLKLATNEGIGNRVEITNRPGGRLSLWTAGAGDTFNLTKDGKVGIGTTNPQVKLDVRGEIRGKLWFSNEYELDVPRRAGTVFVKMLSSNNCAAFITSVCGRFEGGGERVWVEIRGDGFWYLCGHSLQNGDLQVKARCIGMP